MTLVGNLDEVQLHALLETYCSGKQTARLLVDWPDAQAVFWIRSGELVDAALGRLTGDDAVLSALGRPGGVFRVDLGIEPTRRTVQQSAARLILEASHRFGEERARTGPAPPPPRPLRAVETAKLPAVETAKAPPAVKAPTFAVAGLGGATSVAAGGSRRVAWIAAACGALLIGLLIFFLYFRKPHLFAPSSPAPRAAGGSTVSLGMSAALTGPSKELGRQMKLGIETALGLANEAAGPGGRRFTLTALDDGYEPARTKEVMRELVETRKVFAIVGNVGTPTAEVAVPYALEKRILFFGAFTGAGLLRKDPPDRYVFNYRASYAEETAVAVRYLVEVRKLRPEQIAVFAQQDGFGDAGFAGVAKALRPYGRDPEQILRVGFKRNTLEIGAAVARVVAARKDLRAVVIVAPYRPAAHFIEKIRDAGLDLICTNVSFVGSTALAEELRQLGPRYSSGVIVTQVVPPVDSSSTVVLRYRNALARYFPGEKPDFVSLEGYIATNVLLEGFRRVHDNLTTETLVNALESIRGFDMGLGTPLSFGLSEHQASHKVWGTVLNETANYQVLDLQ